MNTIRIAILIYLISIIPLGAAFGTDFSGINFKPGNYEINNWIEAPGKESTMKEKHNECLSVGDLGPETYKESSCTLLSNQRYGNTISWEYRCSTNKIENISGTITYAGDNFKGELIYKDNAGLSLKIPINGRRIGDCNNLK
jgi:hypothetical protein